MSGSEQRDDATERAAAAKRKRRWGLYGLLGLIPIIGVLFSVWAIATMGPSEEAEFALMDGAGVEVSLAAEGWVFAPDDPQWGLVLYPGGKVDPRSYAPLAKDLAEQGVLVIVPEATFNMAIFEVDMAQAALTAHPEVGYWALAGHSLGGVAACRYVAANPEDFDALILLAAYPDEEADLSGADLLTLSVRASEDDVLDAEAYEDAKTRLPAAAEYVEIEGGNHAQFGSYGEQSGDGIASISGAEQREAILEAIQEYVGAAFE